MKSNSWEKFWKGNTAGSVGAFFTFPTIPLEGGGVYIVFAITNKQVSSPSYH